MPSLIKLLERALTAGKQAYRRETFVQQQKRARAKRLAREKRARNK